MMRKETIYIFQGVATLLSLMYIYIYVNTKNEGNMRFKALLWCGIIFACAASLRFLAYQQWFFSQASSIDVDSDFDLDLEHHHVPLRGDVNDIGNEHHLDDNEPKYWNHWCPRKVFIGDAYDGWMVCVPDDREDLSGAVVYSLGVDPGLNSGRGDLEWEFNMERTYRTVHHVWDSSLAAVNTGRVSNLTLHPYDIDVRYVDKSPASTATNLTLDAMLQSQDHKEVAILKVDLSKKNYIGRELELIDTWDCLAYFIPADQVYVQFHHEARGSQAALARAVRQLHALGFRVFHRNERAFSFIRV